MDANLRHVLINYEELNLSANKDLANANSQLHPHGFAEAIFIVFFNILVIVLFLDATQLRTN